MSDDELSDAPSSPLSTALDTTILEASSRATNATATSFASELSDTAQFVKSGGKTYLVNRLGDDIIEASECLKA
jgi:hypothetical protein